MIPKKENGATLRAKTACCAERLRPTFREIEVQAKDRDRIEVKLQPAPVLKPLEGAKELQDLGDEWSLPRNDIQNVLKIPESQRAVE